MKPAAQASVPQVIPRATPIPVQTPFLSVVIVNYRQWRSTARLARQLLHPRASQEMAAEVVIVDNHSPAHPWRKRLRRMPGVSVRCSGRNRGFARGVNEGCRLSRGNWFLLLNPDVTVAQNFIDAVLEYARRLHAGDAKAGVIGFQVRDSVGGLQPSAGRFPTLPNTLLGLFRKRATRKCQPLPGSRRRQVPWLSGCCLLIRRDCFEQLGGFDPNFFLYYEDVDFCRRARLAGWSIRYEPALHVTHHHPLHLRSIPPHLRLLTRHALLTYARKHWPRWQFHVLAATIRVEAAVRRQWAKLRRRRRPASVFGKLGRIAGDMFHGRDARARLRLVRALGATGENVRRTEGRPKKQTS